jgi:hypothetical protein
VQTAVVLADADMPDVADARTLSRDAADPQTHSQRRLSRRRVLRRYPHATPQHSLSPPSTHLTVRLATRPRPESIAGSRRGLHTVPSEDAANTRRLSTQGPLVSALGLGCMWMSWSYGAAKDRGEMPVQYAQGGFERACGTYVLGTIARTVTHRCCGAKVRTLLGRLSAAVRVGWG